MKERNLNKEALHEDLVKCETPKAHIGRIYTLTSKGEEIKKVLNGAEIANKYL